MAPLQLAKGKAMKFETGAVLCAVLLAAGCVSQQKYNTEVQQVDTLSVQKQTAERLQPEALDRGQGRPGADPAAAGTAEGDRGQRAPLPRRRIYAERQGRGVAGEDGADAGRFEGPADRDRRLHRQRADRPGAARALSVELGAVDGARHRRAALPLVQGRAVEHAFGAGLRRLAAGGLERHAERPGEEPSRRDRDHRGKPALTQPWATSTHSAPASSTRRSGRCERGVGIAGRRDDDVEARSETSA